MLNNNILPLQPPNYYSLSDEICFFIGDNVVNRFPDVIDEFVDELLYADYLTVCCHVIKDDSDYYIMMTQNFIFNAHWSVRNNLSINKIIYGRDFQAKKTYYYNHDTFLVLMQGGVSVVVKGEKLTTCDETDNDWDMDLEVLQALCNAIDNYFIGSESSQANKVDRKFERRILQPIKDYTKCEDIAEQRGAYSSNYVLYDKRSAGIGEAKRKRYTFYSSTFDPDSEKYKVGESVAIETNEYINDEMKRMLKGRIVDRDMGEDGVEFEIEFYEQFDDDLLPQNDGRIYKMADEKQKKVREEVIRKIENGTVESSYMYQLFSRFELAGYESQDGWEEFRDELLGEKYPPTRSQMEAIRRGIETKDIQLVLGPPGTGKTTVIVSWIKYFIKQGKRVLVSSQNNAAVDNVLERVGRIKEARIIRLGSKIQENCMQYTIDMQVDKTAEKYLEYLGKSKTVIESDISAVREVISRIDSVIDDYGYLADLRNRFAEYAAAIERLTELRQAVDSTKAEYEKLYNDFLRKSIALKKSSEKGFLWRILHWRNTRFLARSKALLSSELDKAVDSYLDSIGSYNREMNIFIESIRSRDYIELKKALLEYKNRCAGYSLNLKLDGPIKAPKLEREYEEGYNRDSKEKILLYREQLKDVEIRLRTVLKALNDWKDAVLTKRNEVVADLLIQNSNVVGATCIGINTRPQFRNLSFDVAIIDECGQILIHSIIVPMSRAPKTLMLGDHLQIPPVVNEELLDVCKMEGVKTDLLEMSFFEYLFKKLEEKSLPNVTRLDEQFRMPGIISDVISEWFYDGNYHSRFDMSKWKPVIAGTSSPLVMISTSKEPKRSEKKFQGGPDESGGYCNPLEAEIAAAIVAKVFHDHGDRNYERVGVISAYSRQVVLIRQKISEFNLGFSEEQLKSMVASLDSFQGQERPLILYSFTRSDPKKNPSAARVGFLKELRRLNVAFTRSQHQLVIIGDFDYLTSCEYELLDPETGEPVPNSSEKRFSEFLLKMIAQAKSKGEYYELADFIDKVGIPW